MNNFFNEKISRFIFDLCKKKEEFYDGNDIEFHVFIYISMLMCKYMKNHLTLLQMDVLEKMKYPSTSLTTMLMLQGKIS